MSKIVFFILTFIWIILGWVFAFFQYQKSIHPISEQIDMKTWKAKIDWIYHISYWTCKWDCRNYSSSNSTSRWWGGFSWK